MRPPDSQIKAPKWAAAGMLTAELFILFTGLEKKKKKTQQDLAARGPFLCRILNSNLKGRKQQPPKVVK